MKRGGWLAALLALGAVACSKAPGDSAQTDLAGAMADLAATNSMLPTWMLEDVQPDSPRSGQTYGLSQFLGRTLVVTLVEGF
jgi:hypothetical protein